MVRCHPDQQRGMRIRWKKSEMLKAGEVVCLFLKARLAVPQLSEFKRGYEKAVVAQVR